MRFRLFWARQVRASCMLERLAPRINGIDIAVGASRTDPGRPEGARPLLHRWMESTRTRVHKALALRRLPQLQEDIATVRRSDGVLDLCGSRGWARSASRGLLIQGWLGSGRRLNQRRRRIFGAAYPTAVQQLTRSFWAPDILQT
jgi:hypothetical protein